MLLLDSLWCGLRVVFYILLVGGLVVVCLCFSWWFGGCSLQLCLKVVLFDDCVS